MSEIKKFINIKYNVLGL